MLRHPALPENLREVVFAQLADTEGELAYARAVREIIWAWLEDAGALREDGTVDVVLLDDATRMRCLRYYTLLCGYLPERPSKEVVELLKELSYRFVAIEAGRKGKADGLAPATMFCLLHLPTAKLAAGPFSKELAEEATDPRVRIELIQCVADMYRVWGDRLDVVDERTGKAWTRLDWTNYWVHVLENTTDPEALAMLAQALIKITWDRRELVGARQMMKNLVVLYAVHATGNNQALIQPLQFFLRSYSHSGAVRQDVVREVFLDAYIYTCELYHEDSVHQKPLSPDALINCYLEWTDSSRVIRTDSGVNKADDAVQLRLAIDIAYALLGRRGPSEERHVITREADRRPLALMLPHLTFPEPEDVDLYQICSLELLLENLVTDRYGPKHKDAKNAVAALKKRVQSKYKKQLESLTREEWRELVEFRELFEFLDTL
ncbi:uncharacterized protein SCHCODRAFT_02465112, partial [Schizophyllum commune H4-8]|uniref:uncharacterized protein n=1 Tax=Schizophyllum commune (strain H4-8 / FGSC 9210) TaxID=578458 RepID=UPI00215F083E